MEGLFKENLMVKTVKELKGMYPEFEGFKGVKEALVDAIMESIVPEVEAPESELLGSEGFIPDLHQNGHSEASIGDVNGGDPGEEEVKEPEGGSGITDPGATEPEQDNETLEGITESVQAVSSPVDFKSVERGKIASGMDAFKKGRK